MRLPRSQMDQAARTLHSAFGDDPMWTALLPDPRERERVMPVLWRGVVAYCHRYGTVATTPASDGIAAWIRPGAGHMTLWKYVRTGFLLPRAVMKMSTPSRERFLAVMSQIDTIHHRIMPDPHWYLWALGVAPASQSQGYGRMLVQQGIRTASKEGTPCYLETQNEANVAFYRSLGFELIHESGFQGVTLRMWFMRTEARDQEPGGMHARTT